MVSFFIFPLPRRTKRLVACASLGAYIQGSTFLDDAAIARLNTLMTLGRDNQALKLPVMLSKVIWDGKVKKINLGQTEEIDAFQSFTLTRRVSDYLQAMPSWLRYGEETTIRRDLEKLFANFQTA
jgi:hypothetical protein